MASSAPIKRAQVVSMCGLCYENSAKWKCIDCEMCLCEKCKTFHLRVPVTSKHQIITITTPIQDVERKIVTDDIPCEKHVTNLTCMFCKTCDWLVCPECASTSHTKHRFIPIEKALNEKLKFLRGTQTNVNDLLKVCDSKTKEIQTMMPQYYSICDNSVTKIKRREKELHDAISEHSKALQEMVETYRSMVKTIVFKVEQQVDGARKNLEDLKERLETTLASVQGQVVFDTTVIEPVLNFDSLPNTISIFIPETETTTKIQELFGSLQDMIIPQVNTELHILSDSLETTIPRGPPELNILSDSPELPVAVVNPELGFKVRRTITTDLPYISKVIQLDEATAWISRSSSIKPVIRKVTIQEKNIVTSNEITLSFHDMALTSNNDILVTKKNSSDVKLITESMEIKTFRSVAPLLPMGINVTIDNHVIIGVVEPGAKYTLTDQSQRVVILFDKDGTQKRQYQYDGNSKRLFTFPVRITTNNNQDILVFDSTSYNTGRVVTLDRQGNLRWIYEGHPKNNSITQFDPRGIAITSANYIIVSDRDNHTLHVLSENGNILAYKCMDDIGVKYPMALGLHKSDNLWVGCGTGGEDTGAQLHIIKMSL